MWDDFGSSDLSSTPVIALCRVLCNTGPLHIESLQDVYIHTRSHTHILYIYMCKQACFYYGKSYMTK